MAYGIGSRCHHDWSVKIMKDLYLPKEMKTKSMGGVSKKVIGDVSSDMIIEATTTATEY